MISNRFKLDLRAYSMITAIIVIWTLFAILDPNFLTIRNLSNLLVQMSVTSILAIGMVLIIVTGNIDLSVGSLVGLTGGIAAILQVWYGWHTIPVILLTLLIGAMIGFIQGWWIAYRAVPAFIVTLGGMLIFRGVLTGITKSQTIAPLDESFKLIGQGYLIPIFGYFIAALASILILLIMIKRRKNRIRYAFTSTSQSMTYLIWFLICISIFAFVFFINQYQGVPIPFMAVIFLACIFTFIAKKTVFGRQVYAIGGNPEAAFLSGIPIKKRILTVFILGNTLAAIAGLILTARVNAATVSAGTMYELDAIAACVIGGTSLMGGVGTITGAIIGALVMASLDNGMSLMNIDSFWQLIVKGSILILAVWFDIYSQRKTA
ncbi:sugar ABC transporter permease [Hazenella sp. IB182357]|uniref:Xylose transport system permease protein XylH n=1 Tax=Polycladospora coralii TaxID=2771432 RepID=A0A926RYI0_9BACL|nr:sugar ABC transporter permease [Polycladospora coralii]MBD1373531.1 sugar ABC transporter permease [Polycladospora coralii]MBS7531899.1 sugar ABC transporter permease [Polycladospora coralii]